jgi:hypothetical protein
MAATNSACKAFLFPKNWEKQPMHKPSEFLNTPHAKAFTRFFVEVPSVLTFIQVGKGGDQITSLMVGALGGLMLTLQALRLLNSNISPLAVFFVLLPALETLAMIKFMADFQCSCLSWNLI